MLIGTESIETFARHQQFDLLYLGWGMLPTQDIAWKNLIAPGKNHNNSWKASAELQSVLFYFNINIYLKANIYLKTITIEGKFICNVENLFA